MPANLVALYDAAASGCDSPWITGAVLAAQGKQESDHFAPDVIDGRRRSHAGAMGIAQFMPGSWRKEWGNPYDVNDAIHAQGFHMCQLSKAAGVLKTYHAMGGTGDRASLPFVLSAYNAGPGYLHATYKEGFDAKGRSLGWWKGVAPFDETQKYIGRILDWSGQYEGMDAELIRRTQSLLNASNHNLWLRFGWRSNEEQTQLWDDYQASLNGGPPAPVAAAPGTSNHQRGLAADINGDRNAIAQLAPQHGLCLPLLETLGEWWHLEKC